MDVKERGYYNVDWIRLVQDRVRWRDLVKSVLNFWLRIWREIS